VWSLDGKTMAEDAIVPLRRGEVFRLELVNDTMMHHPIHLHGHFFRVLNGQGARSPLKHTVDIPPMGRRTLEFEANETGDWMFHCHILYHMMSGMARVFSYQEPGAEHQPHLGEHSHDPWYFWGAASIQSHMSDGLLTLRNTRNDLLLGWEAGWENVEKTRYEVDAVYQRYFNADFQAFLGARLTNDDDAEDRAIIGFNYRLPLIVWANVSLDSEGDARITLAKRFQLTSRLGAFGRVEYDTNTEWEWSAGAEFTLNKPVSLIAQYHSDYGFGAGLSIRF
jgi:Multicopper oxidase